MIRLNVSEEALKTGVGLDKIVQKIFWYQIFFKDAVGKDIRLIQKQKELYESKNKTTIQYQRTSGKTKAYFNVLKQQCDTATNTFIGRVPDIVSKNGAKEIERISRFTTAQKHHEFEEQITDVALQMSICGSGFLLLYADTNDTFPRYRSLDPLYTNVVYDCTVAMKRLFAYHIYWEEEGDGDSISGKYVCIIYTKDRMYAYKTTQISIPTKLAFEVYPLELFLIDGAEPSYFAPHGFSDIPIYEFQNNKACFGDCQPVLGVIDMYNALQNNRFQNVDDIINYLLVVKNVGLGNEEETEKAINLVKNNRILPLMGQDTDAKFLSNPLNQTDIQVLTNDYKTFITSTTGIPDFTSVDFTQNASDPILKAKTKPLLDLCMSKEKWFNRSYFPMLKTTLEFVKENDAKLYDKIKFDVDTIDLVYSHTLPSNDNDMVNMIANLCNVGIGNPRVLLQGVNAIPNVDEYLKGMYEWNEYIDNRKQELNNKNNGVNETNLERQNQKIITNGNQDNKNNYIIGKSQDISENKVV